MKKVVLFIVITFITLPVFGQRIGFSSNSIIRFTGPNGVNVNYNHYLTNSIDLNIRLAFLWESLELPDKTKSTDYYIPLTVGTKMYLVSGSFKPYLNLEVGVVYTSATIQLYTNNSSINGQNSQIYQGFEMEKRIEPSLALSLGTMIELSDKFNLDLAYKQFTSINHNSRARFGLIDIGVIYQL